MTPAVRSCCRTGPELHDAAVSGKRTEAGHRDDQGRLVMNDATRVADRIAGALGDATGSYERLVSDGICQALGVDPAFRGQLVPAPTISTKTVAWLHQASGGPAADSAQELLAALKL